MWDAQALGKTEALSRKPDLGNALSPPGRLEDSLPVWSLPSLGWPGWKSQLEVG